MLLYEDRKRLLLEAMSVTEEVADAVDMLENDISKEFGKHKSQQVADGVEQCRYEKDYNLFGGYINISFTVYNFYNEGVYAKEKDKLKAVNKFDAYHQVIYVTMFLIRFHPHPIDVEGALHHELMHYFEWCKKGRVNGTIMTPLERAAVYAQDIIDKDDGSTYDPKVGIAYLIYFSDWEEQSAFVNSYLTQAENSMQDYLNNTTPTENNFASYKVLYEWLQENINDRDVIAAIEDYRKYGFNPKMFLNYVAKNFNRFKNKLNHVRAYAAKKFNQTQYIREAANRFIQLLKER